MSPLAEARKHHLPNQFSPAEVRSSARVWIERITPLTEPCMGDACQYRGDDNDACALTVHHTLFPRSEIAKSQRGPLIHARRSPASKILVHECRHADIHRRKKAFPFPEDDRVVAAYYREAKVIEDLAITALGIEELDFDTSAEGEHLDEDGVQAYLIEREYLRKRRQELLNRMAGFKIIRKEVVVGALLELAPERLDSDQEGGEQVAMINLSDREINTLRIRQKQDNTFWQNAP